MPLAQTVARQVKQARLESGLDLTEGAAHLGVSYQTLIGYESGKIRLTIDRLEHIARRFNKSVSFFLLPSNQNESSDSISDLIEYLSSEDRREVMEFIRFKLGRRVEAAVNDAGAAKPPPKKAKSPGPGAKLKKGTSS